MHNRIENLVKVWKNPNDKPYIFDVGRIEFQSRLKFYFVAQFKEAWSKQFIKKVEATTSKLDPYSFFKEYVDRMVTYLEGY